MEYDPLAKYRGSKRPPTSPVTAATEPEEYIAFKGKDKNLHLRIRCLEGYTSAPLYNILLNIDSDEKKGTNFALVFSVMIVEVIGENLQELIAALHEHLVSSIQVYDPEQWPKPKNPKAAFISSIKITAVDTGKPLPEGLV